MTTQFFRLLQQFFYRSGNLYLFSVDEEGHAYNDILGEKEEAHYVRALFEEYVDMDFSKALNDYGIEEVIPIETPVAYMALYEIVWRYERKIQGLTYVLGFVEDEIPAGEGLPVNVLRTTREKIEQNIADMFRLGQFLMEFKSHAQEAIKAKSEAEEEKNKVRQDWVRSSLMTEVMQHLEAEGSLKRIVADILEKICSFMNIDEGILYEIAPDETGVQRLVHWSRAEGEATYNIPAGEVRDYPFMNGLTYTISGNTKVTQEWKEFLDKEKIHAIITMPINVKNEAPMYVAFCCKNIYRNWSMEETKFLYDLRKIIQSIVGKKMAQRALYTSLNSMEQILNNIGNGVFATNPETGEILFDNEKFGKDFSKELRGIEEMHSLFTGTADELEIYMSGRHKWFHIYRSDIKWVDGNMVYLFTVNDITKMKDYEKQMEVTVNSDFLTGLYNRVRCEADIRLYLEMTKNYGGEGALFFIDLDDFKHINDGLGHQYGDILLKEISSDLRKIPGIESTCYRVGGDEFMVIVANNVYDRMGGIVSSIEEMFSKPWFLKNGDYYCTMSMGVCRFPTDADTVEDIIRKADVALREAKKSGKNRVEFYDSEVATTDVKRLDMEKFMRNACINPAEEFEVLYQPIFDVSLEGNPCVGAEALVRWNSKTMGKVSPGEFIPLAEYLGLINPIGQYVLEEACRHCKFWNDMGHPEYKINVNFSVVQLLQSEIVESISRIIRRTGINPHNLTIEVTESLAVNDMAYMERILSDIKRLGVRVALDDFGTGYSSLSHLRQMPLDIIKIDRSFISDLGKEVYSQVFVKMVAELAAAIGLNMCVEGVENELQYEILKSLNVNLIQGYYFSKPISIDEFEEKYLV